MASEEEILINFLTERTSFTSSVSLSSFINYFPRGTPERLIHSLYEQLKRRANKTTKTVEGNIDEFLNEKGNEQRSLNEKEFNELKKKGSIERINEKLRLLSDILDDELQFAEGNYSLQRELLKKKYRDLSNVILPTSKEYSEFLEPSLQNLLQLVKESN